MECKWTIFHCECQKNKCFNLNLLECKSWTNATAMSRFFSFNLNLLECKFQFNIINISKEKRFNLNLLECKCWKYNVCFSFIKRFNLNLLECKFWMSLYFIKRLKVLISTYWNVNISIISKSNTIEISFNLNILECK